MDSDKSGKAERLREAGLPVEVLSDRVLAQVELLDEDEIDTLISIRKKLNRDLRSDLEAAVDSVGVVVW